ncbi:MAG: ABC-2 transporter permease [Oscillospiraceae bacterium]|nr:ABC-2 transporter permease [Oscillospiraceae bacterium]
MSAVFSREFMAYFRTPLGYVIVAAMFFFTGYYFFTFNIIGNTTNTSGMFSMLFSVVLFLVPVLTMRLLSEERRVKTDQTLLTSPVSRLGIVLSKYLAALCVYAVAVSGTLVMAMVLQVYAQPDWPVVLGNFTGLILLGMALIAICLFISSLTESQVIAAIGGFGASLLLVAMDALHVVAANRLLRTVLRHMSFNSRYSGFTVGVISLADVVFFASIAVCFVLLTVLVLERRRWS